jgi:hypothetical protein
MTYRCLLKGREFQLKYSAKPEVNEMVARLVPFSL